VIRDLTEKDCAVIGIEIWLPTEPGPTIPSPGIYTWDAPSRRAGEPWSVFAPRVNAEAADYVRAFFWHPHDEKYSSEMPYFNLTVVEERDS
jgi:hypothetical protein